MRIRDKFLASAATASLLHNIPARSATIASDLKSSHPGEQ